MAALQRADMPQEQRKDFYLYIDEFQNFITDSVATILSEARKYRLSLNIAHQYMGQLVSDKGDTKIRDAVLGNAGTIATFRIGPDDAQILEKEFAPVFSAHDLINIEKYTCYLKLLIDNTAAKPFNLKVDPPAQPNQELAKKIKELSRAKHVKTMDKDKKKNKFVLEGTETVEPTPSNQKQEIILKILNQMKDNLDSLVSIMEQGTEFSADEIDNLNSQQDDIKAGIGAAAKGRIIEGVFNGELMVGSDGKEYTVPANYASKSKLIEGDILKLSINNEGNFVYKQIGPIERQRVVGELTYDKEKDEYYVTGEGKTWRVRPASVTYFKGEPGDETVILVPKEMPSKWAAVENIIKK
jgi:hypothetical protein